MRAPSKAHVRETQVGLFVLLGCIVIALFSFKITKMPVFRRGTPLNVYLNDATGIFIDSKVKMAGIDVGSITGIYLENGKARIEVLINSNVEIPRNAKISPRPLGILGDKFLDIVLPKEKVDDSKVGKDDDDEAPLPLPKADAPQSSIMRWILPEAVAQETTPARTPAPAAPSRVYRKGETVKGVDASVTIDDLSRQLGAASQDLKDISGNVKRLVRDNQGELTQMIHTMNRITTKIERAIDGFDEKKLRNDLKNLSHAVGNVSGTMKNIESITSKIDRGEGSLGKLVNDPATVNELNRALNVIVNVVEKARRTLTIIDMNGEYAFSPHQAKSYIGLTIQPREDTAYIGQIIIDPRGYETRKTVKTTNQLTGEVVSSQEIVTNEKNDLKFSLQFMKRVENLSVRLGLFESSGGFGLDYSFIRDRLQLTLEVFNWSRENNNAHLKVFAKVNLLNYFYILAGGDDLLAKRQGDTAQKSFFTGVGLRFTDEDLKTLLVMKSVP